MLAQGKISPSLLHSRNESTGESWRGCQASMYLDYQLYTEECFDGSSFRYGRNIEFFQRFERY